MRSQSQLTNDKYIMMGLLFSENFIVLLRVNWYVPYIQGQKNETFSTRGGTSLNMSLGVRITCGMSHCNGDFVVVATKSTIGRL